MGNRVVYGNTRSSNGWPMVDEGSCTWVDIPGTDPVVRIQIQNGQPLAILRALVADINAYVEHVRDADTACWTAGNKVSTSNHLSGTAVDVDWDSHAFEVPDAGWNRDQINTLREILDFYEGTVFWGNDWTDPKDAMHFQLASLANGGDINTFGNPHTQDFINRKIRSDGFSTFRRGGDITPPVILAPPATNAIDVLARATGISHDKAAQVQPLVSFALGKCNCTNPRRIAAALAQWVIESGHFVYTEEIADGPEDQERWKYKGRTWIQLTWLENYLGFSRWCFSLGLVPSPTYFGDHPHELADEKWAALGPAYWWAVKYPQINDYADRGDIDNVSKWVNAPAWVGDPSKHANGEAERRDVYNDALALGDELLVLVSPTSSTTPTSGDDELSAEDSRKIDLILQELTKRFPSRSPLRHLGEGLVDTMAGFILNADGSEHVEICRLLAGYGHPPTLALLREVASADPVRYPDRQDDAKLAQAILAEATTLVTAPSKAPPVATVAPAPQIVYVDRPVPAPEPLAPVALERVAPAVVNYAAPAGTPTSAGQIIGAAYDALAALDLSADLPPEAKAPLDALLSVLQTKVNPS